MEKKLVVLKSEVLYEGKGCPVCGGEKSQAARTDRACLQKLGPAVTNAIDAVVESCAYAKKGNEASTKGAFKRGVVFGPVLAQVRIDKQAVYHIGHGNIAPYWDCEKSIPGGFVSLYIFGADEKCAGDEVTAVVHFKHKEHRPGQIVHYLRAQAVPAAAAEVRSNVRLCVVKQEDSGNLSMNFPIEMIEEGRRKFAVGFQYINREDRPETSDPLLNQLAGAVEKQMTPAA